MIKVVGCQGWIINEHVPGRRTAAVSREEQETLAALVLILPAPPVGHCTGRDHGENASDSVGSCPGWPMPWET